MSTVTVSDKGQVVIPADIRRRLGIAPGSKLDFEIEGDSIRARLCKSIPPSRAEDGYGWGSHTSTPRSLNVSPTH